MCCIISQTQTRTRHCVIIPQQAQRVFVLFEGELVLLGSLDHETTPSYELVIEVSDGGIDGDNVLSASATVNITVVDTTTSPPQFDNDGVYRVNVTEESTRTNIVTVNMERSLI